MTAILPGAPGPFAAAASHASGTPGPASGASFADTLVTLLDRALVELPDRPPARFAAGTMRGSVERFNERGFFEDRAATAWQDPLLASAPDQAGASQPPAPPPGALPVLASDPSRAPESSLGTGLGPVAPAGLASDPVLSGQLTIGGSPAVAPLRPGAAASGAPSLASSPFPRLSAAEPVDGAASPDGPRRAAVREQAPAASRVKVSIDHGEAGVSVTVVADAEPEGDAGSMHEAVAKLLARHGLVLSELRVSRSPGAAGQDRKD
jgi:hypothetical protein